MLHLADVASTVLRLLGDEPPRPLPSLPGALESFEAVVLETPLRPGPLRVDVMGAARTGRAPLSDPSRPGVLLPAGIPLMWLEWDIPSPSTVVGPLRFYCLSDAILGPYAEQRPPAEREAWGRWAREVVAALAPDPDPAWCEQTDRLVSALADDGILVHVASLEPRGHRRLRLVFLLRAQHVADWLARVGWPGDVAEIARALEQTVRPSAWVGIQLELSPGLERPLGIELPVIRDIEAACAEGTRYLREAAVLSSCGTDRGRAALSQWLGGPPDAAIDAARFGYLKLCRGEREWAAKLYLGAQSHRVSHEMSRAARAYLNRWTGHGG